MKNEIESSIEKSFLQTNLSYLSAGLGEVAIDAIMKDGLLKDIPILGTIVKLSQVGMNIRDIIFSKMILQFLYNFEKVPLCDREKLVSKFESDSKYRSKFGTYLLTLINKLDEFDKANLVALCFKAYSQEKISYNDLLRMNHGVSQLLLANMDELINFYEKPKYVINENALQNLGNSGFVLIASSYGGGLGPVQSEIGEYFMIYCLNKNIKLKAKDIKNRNEKRRQEEKIQMMKNK